MFENDVKTYGTQAKTKNVKKIYWFENDVKTYGTQALLFGGKIFVAFENDVKTYGTQAITIKAKNHTMFVVDFHFKNNITILMENSGTGKTAAFSFMKECMAVNPNIICLNYLDYQKDILNIIKEAKGKLIVIDNADVLLNDETRKYISLDGENQYLIIGRNPKNLFELVSEKVGEQTRFSIREYL